MKLKGNLILLQSGGPTAVINSSILGVIQEAKRHPEIKKIFGAINGTLGVVREELADLGKESPKSLKLLNQTPSSALGSSRYKVDQEALERIFEVLRAHNIRYFIIAGGNDSMDTASKVEKFSQERDYEIWVMGIPKTVDNDLVLTDHSPGFPSVARWWAISAREAGLDTKAIYTSDTVKILETMGRDSGWITASTSLARETKDDPPHLIYLPEVPFKKDKFLEDVKKVYKKFGYVVISVCEGLKDERGQTIVEKKEALQVDPFGHAQRGGIGEFLCKLISASLNIKARADKPGTIQRVSSVLTSSLDIKEAYAVGQRAVREIVSHRSGKMVAIKRVSSKPYRAKLELVNLEEVAGKTKLLPREFINQEGNDVTQKFYDYAWPLIGGFLPPYARLKKVLVKKRLL